MEHQVCLFRKIFDGTVTVRKPTKFVTSTATMQNSVGISRPEKNSRKKPGHLQAQWSFTTATLESFYSQLRLAAQWTNFWSRVQLMAGPALGTLRSIGSMFVVFRTEKLFLSMVRIWGTTFLIEKVRDTVSTSFQLRVTRNDSQTKRDLADAISRIKVYHGLTG